MKLGSSTQAPQAPPPPAARLSLGVAGHREDHPAFAANRARIAQVLEQIFDEVAIAIPPEASGLGPDPGAPIRLHSMLADGLDQLAAECALARGWELVAPLPFGRGLNMAINARPANAAEARALLAGGIDCEGEVRGRAGAIRTLGEKARAFELADADTQIAALFLAKLDAPGDLIAAERFTAHSSQRVALAARVMIEQSDMIIAVWDGASRAFAGGTGHTIAAALAIGAPVVWIDAETPENWRILRAPESLAIASGAAGEDRSALLTALVLDALRPAAEREPAHGRTREAVKSLDGLSWRNHSNPLFHVYRRVETLFGGEASPFRSLRLTYEPPQAVAMGSGASVLAEIRALPRADPDFAQDIEVRVLRRFAWADGLSTHFSDLYRGGMTASFLLSGLAIIGGLAYLPFASADQKWLFALVEFGLLVAILAITELAQKRDWHGRWLETRRVAEYFRHSPILLALGAARPPGRWPRGTQTSWPEWYARQSLREVGLPRVAVNQDYLRAVLKGLLDAHVVRQRDYHEAKARRLTTAHRNLERLSQTLFQFAVASVALYLALRTGTAMSIIPEVLPHGASKLFTFLGVLFPTFGAAMAGIRYFGDFERFAAISEVTAEKLADVHERAQLLLAAPASALDYGRVSDLAHAADEIVVTEIENWQAVFAGKHITVPA
jgi:hypothetical protein